MFKITWQDRVRFVTDIQCCMSPGCSLVNNGHDDVYDLGLYPEKWSDLTIERVTQQEYENWYFDEVKKLMNNAQLVK
jgi:hypothetical protein